MVACTSNPFKEDDDSFDPAVKETEVSSSSQQERETLVELRKNDEIITTDLARVNQDTIRKINQTRNLEEIKGGESGINFYSKTWQDFPVSLNLNAVPVRLFFQMLQEQTAINFVLGDEVKGDLSIQLNNVGWVEALQIVVDNKNLITEVNNDGSIVTVHTHDFAAEHSESLKKALTAKTDVIKAYASLEPKVTSIVRLYYSKPDVLAQQLKDIIATIDNSGDASASSSSTNTRASFVVDARSNSLIIQATSTDMEWIKQAIANLDKPTKQVLVEVFIVEASDDFQLQLGSRVGLYSSSSSKNIDVGGTVTGGVDSAGDINMSTGGDGAAANNPITGALGAIGIVTGSDTTKLRVELQAMQEESLIKIVSNPKLFILDNEEASITDGQEVPYFSQTQAGATPTTEFKNASLQLQVKPSVIEDGNIYLDLTINKDTPLTGSNPPPISKKELKTKLLVKDGGIALIGGINKTENTSAEGGLPILKDIPGLGYLFKSKDDIKKKNQLYIFIAPKVVDNG